MSAAASPAPAPDPGGIVTRPCPHSVTDGVARLEAICEQKGLKVFDVVDHSGEAQRAGQHMPDTKLVLFGSPAAGTPVMLAAPLAALDLPLKILIFENDGGDTFLSYNAPSYLAARHHLDEQLTGRIAGVEAVAAAVVAP